ncbi:aspartate dehydrogenase [Yoonia litorea]|uniref:L-aspartate dehydrogenase n=1 Tax=Yoonia litorea TaxID=1123755 RepID=A0A1I6MZ51_9RHOB|nr:aspartate dehydrogenase [Yoonia litorea]SFS20973.1 aspartate dehydrogenase [Yoonia litorea]
MILTCRTAINGSSFAITRSSQMKVAIIGQGAIGSFVRGKLAQLDITEVGQIVRSGKDDANAVPPMVSELAALPEKPDLVIDCGGHTALAEFGPLALEAGFDVLTVSLGALADTDLEARLAVAAKAGNARLHLASGAIGALDALRSAVSGDLDAVVYTGRKPPQGWVGSPAETVLKLDTLTEATVHFEGTAREAALRYPKNANVAAAVALSGIGFDRTRVKLIADPHVDKNVHQISAQGEFGSLTFEISGAGLPENPKSSALAAMSVVAALREMQKAVGF